VQKRYLMQAAAFNLGLVMRKQLGHGTPRGFAAAARRLLAFVSSVVVTLLVAFDLISDSAQEEHANRRSLLHPRAGLRLTHSSTGC
jgi:hypothetical protein